MITMNELVENKTNKEYHTVYETTNSVNGKIYVGVHTTTNLNDEYVGSGKYLWKAINKHGEDKFTKKILAILETRQDAFDLERKLVNREFVAREDTYNLMVGGDFNSAGKDHPNYGKTMTFTEEHRKNLRIAHKTRDNYKMFTKEAREKMSQAKLGKGNPALLGSKFYTNGKEERTFRPSEEIPDGFKLGRFRVKCEICGILTDRSNFGRYHANGKCKITKRKLK